LISVFARLALILTIASPLARDGLAQAPESSLRISAGFGYDMIEQGYYLSDSDTLLIDEDSLLTLKRESEEISTMRLKSLVDWTVRPSDDREYRVSNLAIATEEDIRNNLQLGLTTGAFRLDNEFEFRAILNREETDRVGYFTNQTTTRFEPEIASGWKLKTREAFEILRFDGDGAYSYDYNYNRFQLGIEKRFGWFNSFELYYRNDLRDVTDSTRLGYIRHRGVFEVNWSPSYVLDIELENQLTRNESLKESDVDDGWENYFEADVTLRPNMSLSIRFSETLEYAVYDTQEVVSFNSVYSLSEIKLSRYVSPMFEIFVEPSYKVFWSEYVEFEEQDYNQYAVEVGLDYASGTRLWFTAYHKIGKRDYTFADGEFYTDYILNRLTVLGNVELMKGLRFDLLLSVDWEDHDSEIDDNDLILVSAGLDYRFK